MSESLSGNFKIAVQLRDSILKRIDKTRDRVNEKKHFNDVAELKRLVSYPFSGSYKAARQNFSDKIRAEIAAMPDFQQTASHWPSLSQDQRTNFLNRCLAAMARLQATDGIPMRPPALKWFYNKDSNPAEFGFRFGDLKGQEDAIALNGNPMALNAETLSQSLFNVMKQQRYIYQGWLARAVDHQQIDSGHPLFEDARTISSVYEHGINLDKRILSAWLSQPHEEDAAGLASSIRNFVERFEATPDVRTRIRNGIERRRP